MNNNIKHFRGVRKTAVASCFLREEKGKAIKINGKLYNSYFTPDRAQKIQELLSPLLSHDAHSLYIQLHGGGISSQFYAFMMSSLRCIMAHFPELAESIKKDSKLAPFLKVNPRRAERTKPNKRGARVSETYSRR